MEGLTACGDAVIELREEGWSFFAVVDALGHGPDAAKSADQTVLAAERSKRQPLAQVFETVHRSLSGMRGVVMSALLVEPAGATFAGVGNVEIFGPEGVSRPISMAGTLGGGSYRFRSFELPLSAGQRWVLASDGIKAREVNAILASLRGASADECAEALLTRVTRAHDDASVLVLDVEAA